VSIVPMMPVVGQVPISVPMLGNPSVHAGSDRASSFAVMGLRPLSPQDLAQPCGIRPEWLPFTPPHPDPEGDPQSQPQSRIRPTPGAVLPCRLAREEPHEWGSSERRAPPQTARSGFVGGGRITSERARVRGPFLSSQIEASLEDDVSTSAVTAARTRSPSACRPGAAAPSTAGRTRLEW
jgi:hypothetical protein